MRAHRKPRQHGTATVEFALALPLLLFLMLATAEVGRLLSHYNTLTKSVRDAARYLAANAIQNSTGIVGITQPVQTATVNLVLSGNVAGTGMTLLPGLAAGNVTVANAGAGYVSVSASYTYQPMLGGNLPNFGLGPAINMTIPLNVSVVMKAL